MHGFFRINEAKQEGAGPHWLSELQFRSVVAMRVQQMGRLEEIVHGIKREISIHLNSTFLNHNDDIALTHALSLCLSCITLGFSMLSTINEEAPPSGVFNDSNCPIRIERILHRHEYRLQENYEHGD
jgi:hypothetical protein